MRERIAAGALAYSTDVPVVAVGGDPGVSLAPHAQLPVGELLQLVLLAQSRSAITTLAAAVGPGWEHARARVRRTATRLALHATTVPDEWPGEAPPTTGARPAPRAHTTIGDLARLAGAVAGDGEIRRRLALDGAPIANGALIVRATDPLIARVTAARSTAPAGHAGLLGAIPFFAGVCLCLWAAWRARQSTWGVLPLALIMTLLVANMSGNWIHWKLTWLILAFCLASVFWAPSTPPVFVTGAADVVGRRLELA